jgi:hypothetical protein
MSLSVAARGFQNRCFREISEKCTAKAAVSIGKMNYSDFYATEGGNEPQ